MDFWAAGLGGDSSTVEISRDLLAKRSASEDLRWSGLGPGIVDDVKLGGETASDVLEGVALPDLRFQVAMAEGVEEIEGQHRHEPEVQDGLGAVLVDVIGMPSIDGFVEPLVFDIPACVPQDDDSLMGCPLGCAGGRPHPVGFLGFFAAIDLSADLPSLSAADDP